MQMKKNQHYANESLAGRRLDPNLRRAQLLEHAISAFADAGIERAAHADVAARAKVCLLYTSPSPRDATLSRMPSSA